MNEHDELHDAPLLKQLRGTDPFVVQDGFFDRFPHQVQQHIRQHHKVRWSLWPHLRPAWVLGAAMLALLVMVVVMQRAPVGPELQAGHVEEELVLPDELYLDPWNTNELMAEISSTEGAATGVALGLNAAELAAYIEHEELPIDLILEEL